MIYEEISNVRILNEANVYLKKKKNNYAVNIWLEKGGPHRPRIKVTKGPKFKNNDNVSVGFEPTTGTILAIKDEHFSGTKSEKDECVDIAIAFINYASETLKDGYLDPKGLNNNDIDKCQKEFNRLDNKEFDKLVKDGKENSKVEFK